ncbi:MAG: hypothetical protein J0J03_10710 [Leifsonia sp.]|nr:hypothetical protein [Leifsonia sp.]ODU64420.1 MAG: hypothetical protein ABT06_10525 [Leifsonia sp. SCN 70-46]
MMQLTRRDEQMLDWLNVVRMADMDGVRWALAALKHGHADNPVTTRRANQWVARMAEAGLVERVRPMYRNRQIVWPTYAGAGRTPPALFRQTMRHELAVAAVSARYLAKGYEWSRDRRPESPRDHQGDGLAARGGVVELVEVELTTKKLARYRVIHGILGQRLNGELAAVTYWCTPEVARVVDREADRFVFRDQRNRLVTRGVFDNQGRWIEGSAFAV